MHSVLLIHLQHYISQFRSLDLVFIDDIARFLLLPRFLLLESTYDESSILSQHTHDRYIMFIGSQDPTLYTDHRTALLSSQLVYIHITYIDIVTHTVYVHNGMGVRG